MTDRYSELDDLIALVEDQLEEADLDQVDEWICEVNEAFGFDCLIWLLYEKNMAIPTPAHKICLELYSAFKSSPCNSFLSSGLLEKIELLSKTEVVILHTKFEMLMNSIADRLDQENVDEIKEYIAHHELELAFDHIVWLLDAKDSEITADAYPIYLSLHYTMKDSGLKIMSPDILTKINKLHRSGLSKDRRS